MVALDEVATLRFFAKVVKTDSCWLWTGAKTGAGYGNFYIARRHKPAHVVSWAIEHGWPKLFVLHKCDVRNCVNPDHLFLGTAADNTRDMISKGRFVLSHHAKGSLSHNAKISEEDVRRIREAHAEGAQQNSLANRYGISPASVRDIISRRTWRHC